VYVSLLVVCSILAFSFYRAATQSFTAVESRTFLAYRGAPLAQAVRNASVGDHGLFPLLMSASRRMLGRSELVQRLPTLLGCALFLAAAWLICRRAVGDDSWLHPLGIAAMSLPAPVLDAFAAARGDGLALGLTASASYIMWAARPRLSALAAGLAVASSLAFAVSIAVMSSATLLVYLRRRRFWPFIDDFAGPVLGIAFVFLVIPIANGWRAAPSVTAVWPTIALLVVLAAHRMPSRTAATPFLVAALGLVGFHASQVRATHFDGAVRESGMKHLMRRMADDARDTPTVSLQTSAGLEDCARYYVIRYRLAGLTVVNGDAPASYSIVVGGPESLSGHVLERHELSGTSLVRRN
jgi:hypothetical protein